MANQVIEEYISGVLDGTIPSCKWVKGAVKRHIKDLDNGADRGLYFDEDDAQFILDFFRLYHHSQGEWEGQQFELSGWQQFCLWCAFGWKREDGYRRFRTVYIEIPRKNGKSTLAAGVGLYLFSGDNEAGAQVYSAATTRDQAKIVFNEARSMVLKSPSLRKRIGVYRHNLHIESRACKFEPLGRDADNLDGLNIHGAIVDELHAHKTSEIWDVLETATGSRRQPMMFAITTAGFNKLGVCYELRKYLTKILDGLIKDDSFFGIIYTIDEEDDWRKEDAWIKANPNYGISVKPDDIKRLCDKAMEMPTAQNNFLCKRLNVWTNQETLWMNMEKWNQCAGEVDLTELEGMKCYGGLDLASTSDIAAFALVFKHKSKVKTFLKYWLPKEAVMERVQKNQVPYDVWSRMGIFTLTPGNVTDYSFIRKEINDLRVRFDIKEIAYDRYNASQLVIDLEDDGADMVGFAQNFSSYNAPMKELERLVLNREIIHPDDPVLNWMASNVAAAFDANENIKPDKKASQEKIDGIVALIMAIDRLTRCTNFVSMYENTGV